MIADLFISFQNTEHGCDCGYYSLGKSDIV